VIDNQILFDSIVLTNKYNFIIGIDLTYNISAIYDKKNYTSLNDFYSQIQLALSDSNLFTSELKSSSAPELKSISSTSLASVSPIIVAYVPSSIPASHAGIIYALYSIFIYYFLD
jgi:hypothetical protein